MPSAISTIITRVLIASAASSAIAFGAVAGTKVGVVGALNPKATAVDEDGAKRALKVGDDIYLNDTIETTQGGSAQLMFLDRSALTISPNTSVTIDKFVYDPESEDGSMTLESAKGAFRLIGGALTKKKPVTVKTPVSTIGIRGAIVDTHIAKGPDGSDEAVLLFGKELTMTGSNGQTASTSEFGSGLSMAQNGIPVELPRTTALQNIQNSPVKQAIPETGGDTGGGSEIDQKLNIHTQPSDGNDSGGGDGGDNTGAAPTDNGNTALQTANSDDDSGASTNENASASMNEQMTDEGAGDASSDMMAEMDMDASGENITDTMQEMASNSSQDSNSNPRNDRDERPGNGNGGRAGDSPGNGNGDGRPGNAGPRDENPVADADNDNDNENTNPGGGANNPPPAITANTPPVGDAETLAFYDDGPVNGAPLNLLVNDTDPDMDMLNTVAENIVVYDGADPVGDLAIDADGNVTFTPSPGFSLGAGQTLSVDFDYQLTDGVEPVTQTSTIDLLGKDYFGNTVEWATTPPSLPGTTTKRGILGYEDSGPGDREFGTLKAYQPAADYDFLYETTEENGTAIGAPQSDDYVIGRLPELVGGYSTITPGALLLEDENGVMYLDNNFNGAGYATSNKSLNFYQMVWDDSDTGYLQKVRAYLLNNPIINLGLDISNAQTVYDDMLTQSVNSATATGGIIEYEFLPDARDLTNVDLIDYNSAGSFGPVSPNDVGMLVNWDQRRFLGGYARFMGPNPTMSMTVGKINSDINAVASFTGDDVDGTAFNGAFVQADSGANLTDFGGTQGDLTVETRDLAAEYGAGKPVEGFLVNVDTGAQQATQGAVIGSDANTTLLPTAQNLNVTNTNYQGFTAGLVIDDAGDVSRIEGNGNNVLINIGAAGDRAVGATIDYNQLDPDGTGSGGRQVYFGADAGLPEDSGAIQKDLYGARAGGSLFGGPTDGGLVSMHEAINDTEAGLVCNNCQFLHWGVWSAQHKDGASNIVQQTAQVPYIAGEVFNGDIYAAYGNNPGIVEYDGDALGNFHIGSSDTIVNADGNMDAQIDLMTREIPASGLNIDFTNINGTGLNVNMVNNGVIGLPGSGPNVFSGQLNANIDGNVAANAASVDGALFGPNAREIGGQFQVKGPGGAYGEVKGAGIFAGKCITAPGGC